MTKVQFYDRVEDSKLRFAVIITKTEGHWVFCKHKERSTLEVPGGHREPGEDILATAKRELYRHAVLRGGEGIREGTPQRDRADRDPG